MEDLTTNKTRWTWIKYLIIFKNHIREHNLKTDLQLFILVDRLEWILLEMGHWITWMLGIPKATANIKHRNFPVPSMVRRDQNLEWVSKLIHKLRVISSMGHNQEVSKLKEKEDQLCMTTYWIAEVHKEYKTITVMDNRHNSIMKWINKATLQIVVSPVVLDSSHHLSFLIRR